MKPVRLSKHAQGYIATRGFTPEEVADAIRTCAWQPAELGKLECRKDFPFNAVWHGHHYATKQVRPIFAETETDIVVITVYTYYY